MINEASPISIGDVINSWPTFSIQLHVEWQWHWTAGAVLSETLPLLPTHPLKQQPTDYARSRLDWLVWILRLKWRLTLFSHLLNGTSFGKQQFFTECVELNSVILNIVSRLDIWNKTLAGKRVWNVFCEISTSNAIVCGGAGLEPRSFSLFTLTAARRSWLGRPGSWPGAWPAVAHVCICVCLWKYSSLK